MTVPNRSYADILCGAYELALLTAHWQADQAARTAGARHLYAVDVDVLRFYSNPQSESTYASLVGLMPEDSKRADDATILGMAEMLGRYFFRPTDRPAILLDANFSEFEEMYQAVSNKYLAELSQTLKAMPQASEVLKGLVKEYLKAKEQSPRDFVAAVAKRLRDTLPALYEPYNATREISRWAPLIDLQAPRILSATGVAEIAAALDARYSNLCRPQGLVWQQIIDAWRKAISATSPLESADVHSQALRATDAESMAELEWINRYFHHTGVNCRLLYVSGAPRLYRAALIRFQVIRDVGLAPPKFGSRRQLDIGRYYSLVKPESDVNRLDQLDPNWAPIRDVRCFMVDPDFVDFADRSGELVPNNNSDRRSAIEADLSKWLNLFLSGTRDQFKNASKGYRQLHGLTSRPPSSVERLAVSDFSPEAFETLLRNWNRFASHVAAAHGIERGSRRTARGLIAQVFGGEDPVQILSEALDQEMTELVQNVGRDTIFKEKLGAIIHSTPPLVFSRFDQVEYIIFEIVSGRHPSEVLAVRMQAIDAEIKRLDLSENHRSYLGLLGRAVLCASAGSWGACLALASQAFAIARPASNLDQVSGQDPVTGREAAYLCHHAVRKRVAPVHWWREECRKWAGHWQDALRIESEHTALKKQPLLLRFHHLRFAVEQDALNLAVAFSAAWNAEKFGHTSRIFFIDGEFSSMEDVLNELLEIEGAIYGAAAGMGFKIACHYIVRQLLINQLQRILVLSESVSATYQMALRRCLSLYSSLIERSSEPSHWDLPLSQYDDFVLGCAEAALTRQVEMSIKRQNMRAHMPYDEWKFDRLVRHGLPAGSNSQTG